MLIVNNELVTQWKPLIYKLLGKKGRKYTAEEMNDLFVDVVIKMMENARYYNGDYAIGTWIELQVRSATSHLVKQESEGKDATLHATTSVIPDEVTEDEEDDKGLEYLQEQIAPFLGHLEDTEREVFVDRVWNGLSVKQVAERRHMHEKSISRIMTRATRKLTNIVHSGKRVSRYMEVDTDVPLEHAIKQYDDKHYHTFRMHHFEGYPMVAIQQINGMTIDAIFQLIEETKQFIAMDYGVRV